jgi:hypothetical protein
VNAPLEPEACRIEACEQYADGLLDPAALFKARLAIHRQLARLSGPPRALAASVSLALGVPGLPYPETCTLVVGWIRACHASERDRAQEHLIGLVRDLFGNPFRPVAIMPEWLSWEGGLVATLAEAAYERRTAPGGALCADGLAVLADALEEAGCDDESMLSHLREPGQHARGCWVVDRLTGRS